MTGGTLLVKSGDYYGMTKVAHEGMDLKNIGAMKALVANASIIDDVLIAYLRSRGGIDFEPWDVMDNDQVKDCYITDAGHYDMSDANDRDEMINGMSEFVSEQCEEKELDDEHPWMQLSCGYCDYVLCVDMDNNSAWLNGEKVW
jgi:hypothetical protein